jgi:2',3'-cyclic-nucleotide 2'-phosphodiesterase (5'-nucleotidase family)
VLSHLGEDESETGVNSSGLVAATTGIDVVLDGHTHHVVPRAEMLNKEGKTVVVSQTGEQFHHIGKLVIKDGKFMTELLPTQDNPAVTGYVSAAVTNVLNTVKADMETVTSRVLGTSAYELTVNDGSGHRIVRNAETNLGDFAADAFLNEVGGDIGLVNGGGVRNSIPAGSITYGDVLGAFPFLNVICQVEATGAEIKAMLKKCTENTAVREDGSFPQVSGIKFTIHSASKTVSDIQVYNKEAGEYQPLDDAKKYIIATTDYVYQGGFYRTLQQCPMVKTTTIANSEAIANYMVKLNTTGDTYLNSQGRINIVND